MKATTGDKIARSAQRAMQLARMHTLGMDASVRPAPRSAMRRMIGAIIASSAQHAMQLARMHTSGTAASVRPVLKSAMRATTGAVVSAQYGARGATKSIIGNQCSICSICSKTRADGHEWNGCTCFICSKKRDEGHEWNGCTCFICSKKRDEGHDWNGCTCAICAKKRDEGHDWNGCTCSTCSKKCDEGHDWSKDCSQCSRCGNLRDVSHKWHGCKCINCSRLRPFRPSSSDPKCYPLTMEPGALAEAEKIAKLVGFSCWYFGSEPLYSAGEIVVWQTADFSTTEFTAKCKAYVEVAKELQRPTLATECLALLPLLEKYADWTDGLESKLLANVRLRLKKGG